MLPIRQRAVLLLGPTGSGKTPLGELFERQGLWAAPCVHFDFGANLRSLVAQNRSAATDPHATMPHLPVPSYTVSPLDIPDSDRVFLRQLLASGGLLEDEHFSLAERILRAFLVTCQVTPTTRVVLNGLPRHVGQAVGVDTIFNVEAVLQLRCSSETVIARLETNVGGDRTGRIDDSVEAIRRKIAIFEERTMPLIAHYTSQGVPLQTLEVTPSMTPHEARSRLNKRQ